MPQERHTPMNEWINGMCCATSSCTVLYLFFFLWSPRQWTNLKIKRNELVSRAISKCSRKAKISSYRDVRWLWDEMRWGGFGFLFLRRKTRKKERTHWFSHSMIQWFIRATAKKCLASFLESLSWKERREAGILCIVLYRGFAKIEVAKVL